ncbi:hypothetical protein GCM10027569_21420 [Flindersiella endophytica]
MLPTEGLEDTHSEAKDYPRITGASEIRWTKTTGRFQLTLHNGTCASWQDTDLSLDLGGDLGYQPDNTKLAYRAGSAWKPVAMHWSDPEEPETLESSAVPVDFAPGQTRTYDFRITVPKRPDVRTIGIGAQLAAAGDHAYEWSSSYHVRSYTGVRIKVTAPPSITPSGGWREFQAEVWTEKKLPRDARLDLSTSTYGGPLIHDTARFEEYRSDAWHPLDPKVPATEDFPLPPGEHKRFRFRLEVREVAAQDKDMFGVSARLLLSGEAPGVAPLASDGRPIKPILPVMKVVQPAHRPKQTGDTAEFRVTVDNDAKVDYPAQRIEFTILPSPYLSRIDYRCEPDTGWTRLPTAVGDTRGTFPLPGAAVPDGYHAECRIRITAGKQVDEGLNWYAVMHGADNPRPVQSVQGHL